MTTHPRSLLYGAGMAAGALALAWLINLVFQRSWAAIALFLLAMLVVILLQRMVAGGIPAERESRHRTRSARGEAGPSIRAETAHLSGADLCYGWMALPSLVAALVVVISLLLS